jgi:hypothetical protein
VKNVILFLKHVNPYAKNVKFVEIMSVSHWCVQDFVKNAIQKLIPVLKNRVDLVQNVLLLNLVMNVYLVMNYQGVKNVFKDNFRSLEEDVILLVVPIL